ncbi:MAG TPA: carboxypeptidase-like regulatory domain-containing protein, partial [Niabella sp.]|nr:carboxypeptidase-like regulatory domain-containing protein [Niabella sp.]
MKSLLTIILSLSLFQNVAFARHISGAVKDAENKPIENASVVLLNAKDSSVIKLGAANKNGKYDFENINAGHYIIKATAVGFTPAFSPSFEYKGDDLAVADLHLEKSATQLAAVTVTARKPL